MPKELYLSLFSSFQLFIGLWYVSLQLTVATTLIFLRSFLNVIFTYYIWQRASNMEIYGCISTSSFACNKLIVFFLAMSCQFHYLLFPFIHGLSDLEAELLVLTKHFLSSRSCHCSSSNVTHMCNLMMISILTVLIVGLPRQLKIFVVIRVLCAIGIALYDLVTWRDVSTDIHDSLYKGNVGSSFHFLFRAPLFRALALEIEEKVRHL